MPKEKAVMMKALRDRRKSAGLVKCECYVKPEDRQRLKRYTEQTLKGETNIKKMMPTN